MHDHFSNLSASYNDVRTTDHEPVLYIKKKLRGFKEEIERHFEDVDRVGWTDENAMIVFRKGTGTALMNSND